MAAHTPGPWHKIWQPTLHHATIHGPTVENMPVALVFREQDANLIYTAPQLRTFAQKVAALHPEDFDLDKNLGFDLAREAQQLMAKADGAS